MNHKFDELAKDLAQSVVRRNKNPFLLPVLMVVFGLLLAGQVRAQTLKTLYNFSISPTWNQFGLGPPNNDGINPGGLLLAGTTLYGRALYGGIWDNGTVYKLNTDGTGFAVLHTFTNLSDVSWGTNSDGAEPQALIFSGDSFYGTTLLGGTLGGGTVFKMYTNGTGFTVLHPFTLLSDVNWGTNSDGGFPSGLVLSGTTLYGTAYQGGASGNGTVFRLATDGTDFITLHTFTTVDPNAGTNSDGANPSGYLTPSGNTLYGSASAGGPSGNGTVFKLNTDGSGFTSIHSFTTGGTNSSGTYTNGDGVSPNGGLILSGTTLYGTASIGGSSGSGTLFKLNTDGSGFTVLHSFASTTATNSDNFPVNRDGAYPGGLFLSGTTLYGTAGSGGGSGSGTVFKANTDGTGFTILHSFTAPYGGAPFTNIDGAGPWVMLSGNTLYGTAWDLGWYGSGAIFSLSIPPELTLTHSGQNLLLTWPTNFTGFTLQSTTNLGSSLWTTNFPAPVVVNGQSTVTNPIAGTRQFFRLSQ
jgi:uncharacterized repeat protein (TIGR03803 family)